MATHKELILAITRRDASKAADLMEDHVQKTGEFVMDSINQAHGHTREMHQEALPQ